jgi:tripeptide aminopeptidase
MEPFAFSVAERLMRYVQIDTQSNPKSNTHPSSDKQKNLSALLAGELLQMGAADVVANDFGYVYATIPATTYKNIPVICFCSHLDTAPDCSGTNVKPILHSQYNGKNIVLPDDPTQVINATAHPYLAQKIGTDIITASGLTLLGADDKAGVSILMDFAQYLLANTHIQHGKIRLLFTPDEEVGRGTDKVDLNLLGAHFAYTLDGGELGSFEDETFSANGFTIHIDGVIAHPGYAKGKMINAMKIAGEILAALPKNELTPEITEKRQGFVHPVHIEGGAEKTSIEFIIRDFNTSQLAVYEQVLKTITAAILARYPGASAHYETVEQYRNMKEVLQDFPFVSNYAEQAYLRCGLPFIKEPIRGGTDGSRLSFMGLPCPNIFTGMQAIHSKQEWIAVSDMQKAVEVLVALVQVWEENYTE